MYNVLACCRLLGENCQYTVLTHSNTFRISAVCTEGTCLLLKFVCVASTTKLYIMLLFTYKLIFISLSFHRVARSTRYVLFEIECNNGGGTARKCVKK